MVPAIRRIRQRHSRFMALPIGQRNEMQAAIAAEFYAHAAQDVAILLRRVEKLRLCEYRRQAIRKAALCPA